MTTWGEYQAVVRRSIIRDTDDGSEDFEFTWSPDMLLDHFRWACKQLCAHTALEKYVEMPATGTPYALPDDLYGPLDREGAVITIDGSAISYLQPVNPLQLKLRAASGFSVYPYKTLNVSSELDVDTLGIYYYALYPVPTSDSTVLQIPDWAELAVGYLMGAHAMTAAALRSSTIRQWGERPETGNPEHNPLQKQHDSFIRMYEDEINRHPRQDRAALVRIISEWPMSQ